MHTGNMIGLTESQRLTYNAFRITSIMAIDESCFVLYAGSVENFKIFLKRMEE